MLGLVQQCITAASIGFLVLFEEEVACDFLAIKSDFIPG
jgi:hypothetical protein